MATSKADFNVQAYYSTRGLRRILDNWVSAYTNLACLTAPVKAINKGAAMKIGSSQWKQIVKDGAKAFHLSPLPNDAQMNQLVLHGREMLHWNRKINLTRIVDPAQIAEKHVVDSMAGLRVLPSQGRLLDIGSGAGYPGIVLKIMAPDLEVTLVDSKRKKIHFLKHTLRKLDLKMIIAEHNRIERLSPKQRHGFDMVVSRAVGNIAQLAALARPFLTKDGILVFYKGAVDRLALDACVKELNATGGTIGGDRRHWHLAAYRYQLPGSGARRHLVVADRKRPPGKVHLNALA